LIALLNLDKIKRDAYLPHGYLTLPEEEQVDLSGHVTRLLHVHEVREELLHSGDLPEILQAVPIAIELLGWCLHWLTLHQGMGLGGVSLHIPKLPIGLQGVLSGTGHQTCAATANRLCLGLDLLSITWMLRELRLDLFSGLLSLLLRLDFFVVSLVL
jgi:hypothetical protein